jgi:hypothetical protein
MRPVFLRIPVKGHKIKADRGERDERDASGRHAINGARVAPSTGISLRSLPFIKRKIRKRPDASSDYWIGSPAGIPGGRAASIF